MGDAPAAKSRHPVGLYVLFFVEMWERFGFYCMAAVFRLYLKKSGYPLLENNADQIWGLYLGGVYFSPFFGGLLAEWRLGYKLCISLGAIAMAMGYGLMAFNPPVCLALGLLGIVIGNGLFKPNISTLVGKLYPPGDPRMDSAFTIFYMGINVGALISPIAAAAISNWVDPTEGPSGYLAAFGLASAGMLFSLLLFQVLKRFVTEASETAVNAARVAAGVVTRDVQMQRNVALAVFFCINILFWMAFKQNGNTLALWAADRTDRTPPEWLANGLSSLGLNSFLLTKDSLMSAPLFAAINPFFVIVLSPLLVWLWSGLRRYGFDVPTPAKLVLGFAMTTGAFAIMTMVARNTGPTELASPLALVYTYGVLTFGELCLSPMGLSLVSKLADARTRSIWMGGFFASTAVGGYLSGGVRDLTKSWPVDQFFLLLTCSSAVAMGLMLAAYPIIRRAINPPK